MTVDADYWADSAIKRLDHVYSTLDQIERHGDGPEGTACNGAREQIEWAQEDIRRLADALQEGRP